jgi:hypothetical protein
LGYRISAIGVATCHDKVDVVLNWPTPSCVKKLRSFLGMTGYYRKFIKHFGVIARPLTELLKKNYLFIWTADHDVAFQTLKNALVQAPVLALLDFTKPFLIETHASNYGVRAVLMQDSHPLAFVSKALGPKLRGLFTYEKEYIAILLAMEQWGSYLHFQEFVILTDHQSLSHLNE